MLGMRRSYRKDDFPAGLQRGKYAQRMATDANLVRLKPEIAAAFPTEEAVNAALAAVLRKQRSVRAIPRTSTRSRGK
jgi:hypothetical protein